MQPVLEAHNIIKDFANHRALDEVSLSVPGQKIFGLLGPNGAGKTTLIRIINQITAPDSGTIHFNGKPLNSSHIARIGYLPEERGLYKKMKVGEQAMYLAQLKGLTAKDAKQRLTGWFEKFDIMAWWNRKVEELSKGMQQKVQFVVTVVHEPELLIFDEPFSGFDPINVNLLKDHILELKRKGATIIFSTHNMSSVEELCDNIALIHRSRTILEGSVENLKQQFKPDNIEIIYTNGRLKLQEILGTQFSVLEEKDQGEFKMARIHLEKGTDSNQLIGKLLPDINIKSFREILPTMNDIFINQVNQNENK
ncbi:MAG: ATP-binding cassette domain-containing protein [Bacteroidetes bacterium]|nr:ATP-binding cassette domain-containing protein [Bacteroidota bacterium]